MTAPYAWQNDCWQHFVALKAQQKLPHAVLLTGAPYTGKWDFSQACAQALLGVDAANLALCQSADGHPDHLNIVPESDKMPVVKIDQIRQVKHFLAETAQRGGFRVVCIRQAECMNTAAANALLKTLEEPGQQVLILLVSARPAVLPATILSRCQRWLMRVTFAEARAYLQQHASEYTPEASWQLSQGQPLRFALETERQYVQEKAQFLAVDILTQSPLQLAKQYEAVPLPVVVEWLFAKAVQTLQMPGLKTISQQALFHFLDHLYQAQRDLQKSVHVNPLLFLEDLLIEQQRVYHACR